MLLPVFIGKFELSGPRDHKALDGYPAAFVWAAAQAVDESAFISRVERNMQKEGLTVTRGQNIEQVLDDTKIIPEARRLLREARRQPDLIICGKYHGFEHYGTQPPTLLQLETERLILRPWHRNDREPFAQMNADREVMTYFAGPMSRRQSDEAVDRYLADFDQDGFSFLVAETRDTRAFAGIIGLQIMRDIIPGLPQPAIEIGWRLNREHQGRGLATEGGQAILKLAFNDFQLSEVVAITAIENQASRRVMEKLGMTHRADLEFNHPRLPPRHLYARHTLYQLHNPHLKAANS